MFLLLEEFLLVEIGMLPGVNSLPILVLITRKCNGTVAEVKKIVQILNDGGVYPLASEVSTEFTTKLRFLTFN